MIVSAPRHEPTPGAGIAGTPLVPDVQSGRLRRLIVDAAGNGSLVLAPVPPKGLRQRLTGFDVEGGRLLDTIAAEGGQQAYVLESSESRLTLHYTFAEDPGAYLPEWVWHPPANALSDASPELARFAREGIAARGNDAVRRLATHVTSIFCYGAGEGRFTDGEASVPLVCSTTRGTCIDVHTYFSAALRAAGIDAAYIAGIFVAEGAHEATDMHCWVAVRLGDVVEEWDLSHALITGRRPRPGLTEIPGRRLALSSGRGIHFPATRRSSPLSHLALPCDMGGRVLSARSRIETL